ncbi:amidohydrolase family protein [Paenarthrobacter sp. NPDC056912]|uniref:amidohydrolase family protein n=1 Tax=Paenarthrobacter sp. NPDC056912 TaxID=3345965 RepID=UPI00366CAB55
MFIDTHTHLGGFPAIEELSDVLLTRNDVASWRTKYPEIFERIQREEPVDNSAALLEAMDKNGVDLTVVQPTPGISNDFVRSIAQRHPGRFLPLAQATEWPWGAKPSYELPDPGTPERVARAADRSVNELGFAGIGETNTQSITSHVDPRLVANDFAPLMDVLAPRRLPIQFPSGWTQFPGNLHYQDPLWVDELAGRHPDVPIILTKMGRSIQRYFDSCLTVALRNHNVYLDVVGTSVDHLRTALNALGPDRIMFGTDWTYTWRYLRAPDDVHSTAIRLVKAAAINQDEADGIFGRTAKTVFSIN